MFESKNILLISPEPWGKSQVSKHHYAQELAKQGAKVFFLNAPSSKFEKSEVRTNLYVVDYKPLFRGVHKLFYSLSALLIKKEVIALEEKLGVTFDVIWNFDTSRFFNLSKIKNKLKICHIVDMAENHQRDLLAKTSDFCLCTSEYIKEELLPFNKNVFKIHHGYQLNKTEIDLSHLFGNNSLKVGIVGNLARTCIDWETILKLIYKYPQVEFHFIGGYKTSNLSKINLEKKILDELEKASNVNLIGQVESKHIPSYLIKFDILLCAYKVENKQDVAQHSNLHKIMEYLGSGRAIVTSYVEEFKHKEDLLEMAQPYETIERCFDEVMSKTIEMNSLDLQQKRKDFALSNAYEKQVKRIQNIILKSDL